MQRAEWFECEMAEMCFIPNGLINPRWPQANAPRVYKGCRAVLSDSFEGFCRYLEEDFLKDTSLEKSAFMTSDIGYRSMKLIDPSLTF